MAEEAKRIDRFEPELDRIIELWQPIEELAEGVGRLLLQARLTRDRERRFVVCERETRSVFREERDHSITIVATSFQGRKLNQPNDVVVKSDNCIYFTDPPNVYRVTTDRGITLLIDDFIEPNALAFSPDERVLYINDARRGHIRAFDVAPDGTVARNTGHVLVDMLGEGLDDMKVDAEGNVYCGGAGGLWIIQSTGKKLGRITLGVPTTTKLAFGGDDSKTLYFTMGNHLGRVNVKIPGTGMPLFPSLSDLEGDVPHGKARPRPDST